MGDRDELELDASEPATVREGAPRRSAEPRGGADDRYRPVREIARGGMGRVLEAFDQRLSRTVALKEILDEHPDARARFEREVEITARLEHPSIVPLYDAGTGADGAPFYVMRRVAGEPLDTLIRNATSLDQRLRLLPNVLATADAVAHAHARGVIHRDLKPSNVLVGELGETVVIDWGLAKLIGESDAPRPERPSAGSLTMAGTVFGTPGFMSPEQLAGERVDERTDVYALGGCLYHVLAGRRPPEDGPPDLAIEGAPRELLTIVGKAMAVDRTHRYLDAGGFSEDLRRFLGGQLVAAHHYAWHQRIGRWLRRNRALVAVIAIALAISIGGGVWALRQVLDERAVAEDALAREQLRADDLVIYQASTYLDTNPTLAAGSLVQLREDSPRWATLGPMIDSIRARGIAYGYPSTASSLRVAVSPVAGDDRVLVSGIGIIRLIDPVARTARTLLEDPDIRSAFWVGGAVAVDFDRRPPTLIDPASGARTTAGWPDNSVLAVGGDGTVVYRAATLVVRSPDGHTTPLELSRDTRIELSPSATWLAAIERDHVVLLRRGATGYAPSTTITVTNGEVEFDGDRRIAVASAAGIIEYDLAVSPPAPRRHWPAQPAAWLHYIAGNLHSWTGNAVIRLLDNEVLPPLSTYGVVPETDVADRSARLVESRRIELGNVERHVLIAPEPVDRLLGKRGSPFVIAAGPTRVFVWDVRELTARTSTIPAVDGILFTGTTTAVGVRQLAGQTVHRYQLSPALELEDLGADELPPTATLTVRPHGAVFAVDRDSGRGWLLEPTRVDIAGITGLVALAAIDDATLVGGTDVGEIHRIDRMTGRPLERLASTGFPIRGFVGRNGWLLATSGDDRLWRRDPGGGVTTTVVRTRDDTTIAGDGTVYMARARELLAWNGSELVVVATFDDRLSAIWLVDDKRVVVETAANRIAQVDRSSHAIRRLLDGSRTFAFSDTGGIAVASLDDALVVIDLATGDRYPLVNEIEVSPSGLAVSPDGTEILALTAAEDETRVIAHIWRRVPGTRAWLSAATNAIPPAIAGGPVTYRSTR